MPDRLLTFQRHGCFSMVVRDNPVGFAFDLRRWVVIVCTMLPSWALRWSSLIERSADRLMAANDENVPIRKLDAI